MIYKSTSIKEVIGRVIRNTRIQDSSFINDMGEWIPECMGYMRTRVTLSPQWKDIPIEFHKGKLPCGLRTLTAVTYKGCRLRHNNGVQAYGTSKESRATSAFISQPTTTVTTERTARKLFTADTTAGSLWAVDNLVLGVSVIPVSVALNTSTITADVAALQAKLDSFNIGTFTVDWDGDELTIELTDNGDITGITYHRLTLDAPILNMVLVSDVTSQGATYGTNSLDTVQSVEQACSLAYGSHTYYTELDYINTSICDGSVRLFYRAIPMDEDGFPLIPDNESYKEALYWYVRSKMIGAGYKDIVFRIQDCEQRYEMFAARALGQIKYPSIDQVETSLEISSRLILPDNYFETLFANPGKEGVLDM